VGLAGLEGQGQGHIARSLIGQHPADGGELVVGSVTIPLPLPAEGGVRLTQRLRIGFVPEDRKAEGLLLGATIHDNIVIARQSARQGYRLLQRFADLSRQIMADLNVKAASAAMPVGALSGGNQQKVLLGRYLAADMDILIIEEPTRGVDIGAKSEIYRLLRQLAQAGKAVLVLSRETVELIGLCDRIMVVHGQRVVTEMPGAQASEHAILDAALNHD
jgi:ribose transport system ATP-binding protein